MDIPINYLAVLVAGISAIVIGGLWYGPVFGKQWMALAGISKEGMKSMKMSAGAAMAGGAFVSLLMAYIFAHALIFAGAYTNTSGVSAGLMSAFCAWLGFILPVTAGSFLWEGKSWKLWALNAAYYLVSLLVMGAILSTWV